MRAQLTARGQTRPRRSAPCRHSAQGIRSIKDAPKHAQAAPELAKKWAFYLTDLDIVPINFLATPNDKQHRHILRWRSSHGNRHISTLRVKAGRRFAERKASVRSGGVWS
jgi:hypothetical protein